MPQFQSRRGILSIIGVLASIGHCTLTRWFGSPPEHTGPDASEDQRSDVATDTSVQLLVCVWLCVIQAWSELRSTAEGSCLSKPFQRERERVGDTGIDRQKDRKTERQTHRQTDKDTHTHTHTEGEREPELRSIGSQSCLREPRQTSESAITLTMSPASPRDTHAHTLRTTSVCCLLYTSPSPRDRG
eukprot:1906217-Rhodomonas_salina.1